MANNYGEERHVGALLDEVPRSVTWGPALHPSGERGRVRCRPYRRIQFWSGL